MSDLESIYKIDFSLENIPRIFESQRKNLKQDILFFKEDILKDFRELELKLTTKYEKQNSNTLTKLHKFENTIEAMNNKIFELSKLISTDKNIQQKVLNLQEFKSKVTDKLISQDLSIRINETTIKDTINKYDKILSDSIIYQGVIGNNAQFQNFHQLIDYLLLNINQFVTFKEKNMIDFKGYKAKLESLFKSFKLQADSIINTNNKYINKRVADSEKKMRDLINIQEAKIFDIKLENNKFNSNIDNKIEEMNNEIKKNVDLQTIKAEIYTKIDEEIDLIKDFNKGVTIKFENSENEINLINDKFKALNEYIKEIKMRLKKGDLIHKKESHLRSSISSINVNSPSKNGNYILANKFSRRGSMAKSIVKQYIKGEIGINEIEKPLKRQKSTLINENNLKSLINNNLSSSYQYNNNNKYTNYSLDNISKIKRMTFGPDNFKCFSQLDKNLLNKFMDINPISSDKDRYNKSNNSISEEKSEDIDYLKSFREKNNNNDNDSKMDNNKDKYSNVSKDEENKSNDANNKNKDKNEEGDKITSINNKKTNEINSACQTDFINLDNKENTNLKKRGINTNYINNKKEEKKVTSGKGNYRTISYEREKSKKNNSFPKVVKLDKNQYKIKNQKSISSIGRLHQIGGTGDIINYSKTNSNRFNKTNILFYDINNNLNNMNYNKYNNNILKENKKKINIVEVNFDEPKELFKEEDELKTIIKKIKENRMNFLSERNNRPLEKNKSFKRFQISDSDVCLDNNSMNSTPMTNKANNKGNYL